MTTELKSLDAFAEVQRLIIVAAHPDDLETICGGTVALLVQRGVKVFTVNYNPEKFRQELDAAVEHIKKSAQK